MLKIAPALLAVALGLGLTGQPAHAQLARTFVSAANGNDANDCGRSTPCRTFQGAHDKTFDKGEITVLDPGGYGAVEITKAISIVNDGVGEAGVLVSGGATGITVTAAATAFVNLRGITVQGIGFGGGKGIRFNSGAALTITYCAVRNHTGNGVEIFATAVSQVTMSNTLVADNGGDGVLVSIASPAAAVKAVLSRIESYNNSGAGFSVLLNLNGSNNPRTTTTIVDSVAANNFGAGFQVATILGRLSRLFVIRSVSSNNGTGLFAQGDGRLIGARTVIAGNTVSWAATGGGLVSSFQDNRLAGNQDGDVALSVFENKR